MANTRPIRSREQTRFVIIVTSLCASMQGIGCATEEGIAEDRLERPESGLLESADGRLEDFGVICTLEREAGEGAGVRMLLEHRGDVPLEILGRGLPGDDLAPVFEVSTAGRELRYAGIIASRNAPSKSEFIVIEPGDSLALSYGLELSHRLSEVGEYKVKMRSDVLSARLGDTPLALQHNCGTLHATFRPNMAPAVAVAEQPLIHVGSTCTASQRAQLDQMEVITRQGIALARRFALDGGLYGTWFGTWDSTRADYVDAVLEDIEDAWATFEGECGGTDAVCGGGDICAGGGVNAWVCSGGDNDRIHICTGFFDNPTIGFESWSNQSGILAHEKSHLVSGDGDQSNAACSDGGDNSCYGARDARALAVAAPAQAVESGENYEHFVSQAHFAGVIFPSVL